MDFHALKLIRALALLWTLLGLVSGARGDTTAAGPSFHGIPTIVHDTVISDGAHVKVFELVGHESSSKVDIFEPGVVEHAATFDGGAAAAYALGHRVFVGQVRLAGKGEHKSTGGSTNELEDVLLKDIPAHLRKVIQITGGHHKFSIIGHSMGGIGAMAVLSHDTLGPEFAPKVDTVSLIHSPADFLDASTLLRTQVRLMLPVLKRFKKLLDRDELDPIDSVLELLERMKASRNFAIRKSGQWLETQVLGFSMQVLKHTMVDATHASPEAMKRLIQEGISSLPLEVLIGLGEGVARGQFIGRDGTPLIHPERIKVPTQVVAGKKDYMVSLKSLRSLYSRLGSETKRFVEVDAKHVTVMVTDNPQQDIMPELMSFVHDPVASKAQGNYVTWKPGNPNLVTRAIASDTCLSQAFRVFSGQ